MCSIFTGSGGAVCQCCLATSADVRDPEVVTAGFLLNCDIQTIKEMIIELTSEGQELKTYS